jgi:hypothetical protein
MQYFETDKLQIRTWLIDDIYKFCNLHIPTNEYYTDYFYGILHRHILLNTRCKIETSLNKLINDNNLNNKINFLWGLLLPNERIRMIQCSTQTYGNTISTPLINYVNNNLNININT